MSDHTLVNYGGDYPQIQKYRNGWLVPVNIIETLMEDGNKIYDAYQIFVPVLIEHELTKAFGELKELYPDDFKNAEFYHIREKRDQLIAETDWWVLPDKTPTQEQLEYRQLLRDLPQSYENADDVVFPAKP